jgi:hypothetical protein
VNTSKIISLSFVLLLSIISFIISYFQFKEKGFLFNNAYIYASKEERSKMNKKPHYRQSAIVFSLIGIVFLVIAATVLTGWNWLLPIVIVFAILLVAYAIVSSIIIERKRK